MTYKTPGVYVKEISIFPPSVAEVETAIPAFIGYTEKAERNGESLLNMPTKITSLLEYRELFGGAYNISSVTVNVDPANNYAVSSISIPTNFRMFDALRMFFDNGGGQCYITSVGLYSGGSIAAGDESATPVGSVPGLRVGLKAVELYDEPTMLVFPDAVELANDAEFYGLQQMALAQCNKLMDRVGILDLKESLGWGTSVEGFRNGIGINNLRYGAAYTPFLYSAYSKEVSLSVIRSTIFPVGGGPVFDDAGLINLTSDSSLNDLVSRAIVALDDQGVYDTSVTTIRAGSGTIEGEYDRLRSVLSSLPAAATNAQVEAALTDILVNIFQPLISEAVGWNANFQGTNLQLDLDAYAMDSFNAAFQRLMILEQEGDVTGLFTTARDITAIYGNGGVDTHATGWLSNANPDLSDITVVTPVVYNVGGSLTNLEIAINVLADLNSIFADFMGFYESIREAIITHQGLSQSTLYSTHPIFGNISKRVAKEMSIVPPSGAMAGVYSYVDDNRGVFKAPANVSLSSVAGPVQMIDDDTQEDLNVDVNAGKSINAIRAFSGKGTLVWGARTLAGNDNEWRYISVRRFFNMVEESLKKSTGWAVFEPNDASTWSKVRSMISSFLLQKWKEGALQGATPDDAFFVKIGLGLTMTYDDILNGIMNVEIGMAVVRPAEFIILKFSHKVVENA
ncbi:MAG: phage tail sheath C-terminal domain-containing protein [Bacteroidota bacterium]